MFGLFNKLIGKASTNTSTKLLTKGIPALQKRLMAKSAEPLKTQVEVAEPECFVINIAGQSHVITKQELGEPMTPKKAYSLLTEEYEKKQRQQAWEQHVQFGERMRQRSHEFNTRGY